MEAWTPRVSSYQGGQEDNYRVADAISKKSLATFPWWIVVKVTTTLKNLFCLEDL